MTAPLLLVTGPTHAGKTTLVRALCTAHPEWRRVVACTTRPPRAGEVQGVDYHFLTPGAFEAERKRGAFAECQQVYGGHWYGVRKADLCLPGLLRIAVVHPEGAWHYRRAGIPVRVVCVSAPLDVLRARLRRDDLLHREADALREVGVCLSLCADLVVRGDGALGAATRAVEHLVVRDLFLTSQSNPPWR